jgi:hypothetical protein
LTGHHDFVRQYALSALPYHKHSPVAQSVERVAVNHLVGSSSLSRGASQAQKWVFPPGCPLFCCDDSGYGVVAAFYYCLLPFNSNLVHQQRQIILTIVLALTSASTYLRHSSNAGTRLCVRWHRCNKPSPGRPLLPHHLRGVRISGTFLYMSSFGRKSEN